jgi:hypothetical protein
MKLDLKQQLKSLETQIIRLQAQWELLSQIEQAGGVIEMPDPPKEGVPAEDPSSTSDNISYRK